MRVDISSLFVVLLLAAVLCADVECSRKGSKRQVNPRVLRLVFHNGTDPEPDVPSSLVRATKSRRRNRVPVAYCLESSHPSDVFCDIGTLLDSDVFSAEMAVRILEARFPDPSREKKICSLKFSGPDEGDVNPLRFEEIECGLSSEITDVYEDVGREESEAALPQFRVSKLKDMIVTSYVPVFGCRYRLLRIDDAMGIVSGSSGGSFFKLDSFFCSIGFGAVGGRPESPYPPQTLYKYDGRRWRPSGNWPDYV